MGDATKLGDLKVTPVPGKKPPTVPSITPEDIARQKWNDVGGTPGEAVSDVQPAAGGGFVKHYKNGGIWWKKGFYPRAVCEPIYSKYMELQAEAGVLGYPLTDSQVAADGQGQFCNFQYGAILWHPTTGAHEVHGAIHDKWVALGSANFGYPTSDEYTTVDGAGRVNSFRAMDGHPGEPESRIYWTPATGAHAVYGGIGEKYTKLGSETGYLGYPTTDELPYLPAGRVSNFQHGQIVWDLKTIYDLPHSAKWVFHDTPDGLEYWVTFIFNSNGNWNYYGSFHANGAASFDVTSASVFRFKDYAGKVVAVSEKGTVHGTVAIGSRNYEWNRFGFSPYIREHFDALVAAGMVTQTKADISITDLVESIFVGVPILVGIAVKDAVEWLADNVNFKACGTVHTVTTDEDTGEDTGWDSDPIVGSDDPCPGQY
ncbi:LGFP repeat-containing protein [Paraburkholderia youngii]|uniref:LGFP repeat-containing protein n=1 Tax=Paraburkholderia youngii TaxID=2782701 RepID=UPI0015912DD4|nr:hypothetical protein [Paraburkholderia youngii]NUX55907.1 hypothetical protein [Paraburkholderia youngii]